MMLYHGNTDKYFIWGFLTLLGVAWLLGAYWRYGGIQSGESKKR